MNNTVFIAIMVSCSIILFIAGTIIQVYSYKITVKVENADSDMGKMKVCVESKCKKVNIGKLALYWDDSEFKVKTFKFKHNPGEYTASVGDHIQSGKGKSVTVDIREGEQYRDW